MEGKQIWRPGSFLVNNYKAKYIKLFLPPNMSIDIQKWKAEAHENAAKTVANMLQVGILCACNY